jgi:hypothetical protein
MPLRRLPLALALGLALAGVCRAQSEIGHYAPGVVNAKDFIVPDPGWYYCQYDTYYHSTRFDDEHGKKVDSITVGSVTLPVETQLDYLAVSPTIVWTSPWEVLGGSYGAFVCVPLQTNSVSAEIIGRRFGLTMEESAFGLGDLQVQPVWLGWRGSSYEISAAYGFFAPTGRYALGSSDNVGTGFWSNYLQASLALYLTEDHGTGFFITGTYEINSRNTGEHVTGGDHFCLEYSLSRTIGDRIEVALSGSDVWQTTRDHGSDVTWDTGILDEVHAVGGQFAVWLIPEQAQISLNGMWEYEAKDRTRGYYAMINLMIVVGSAPEPHHKRSP